MSEHTATIHLSRLNSYLIGVFIQSSGIDVTMNIDAFDAHTELSMLAGLLNAVIYIDNRYYYPHTNELEQAIDSMMKL